MHIRNLPEYPEFAERFDVMSEILDGEETKFQETLARGRKMITKAAKGYKENNEKMPLEAIIEMYDSHGIPPEISKDAAAEAGVEVDLPDNFYSLVADTHSKNTKEEKEDVPFADRLKNLPSTKRLFYDEPNRFEFEAVVLDIFENNIVLDTTLFYPEGGGQPADHGTLAVDDILLQVVDVRMINGVVIHNIDRIEHELHIRKGDLVNGKVNEIRRMAHARHHTATHIVNDAARQVLGNHIWQAGAQKFTDRARLDLSHYKRISQNEIDHIEILANRMVMENKRVLSEWMDRTEAEQKYGFGLYQGGVPPGQKIRVLHVGNDIEACAGTHCTYTGQIGPIKILKTERIQDGVERIEYAAGEAAILAMQQTDRLIRRSAETLRVPAEQLPATTERFFDEWKALKKESRKLKEELAHARVSQLVNQAEGVCGVRLLTQFIQGVDAEGLAKMVKQLSAEHSDLVTLLLSDNDGVKVAASAGKAAIKKGANAGLIVRKVTSVVGGGGGGKPDLAQGGGTDPSRIEEALVSGKEVLFTQIQGNGN
jgi:alanyl-tRNA synthetase